VFGEGLAQASGAVMARAQRARYLAIIQQAEVVSFGECSAKLIEGEGSGAVQQRAGDWGDGQVSVVLAIKRPRVMHADFMP